MIIKAKRGDQADRPLALRMPIVKAVDGWHLARQRLVLLGVNKPAVTFTTENTEFFREHCAACVHALRALRGLKPTRNLRRVALVALRCV